MAQHAVGSRVGDITIFDRGTKVTFECPNHPSMGHWRSKDPFCSNWFPANQEACNWSDRGNSLCQCPTRDHILTEPYESIDL